jgi:hypothetical protein
MAKNIFLAGCPADCDDVNLLPAIPDEQDCTSYALLYSQLCDLYIVPTGATNPLASWSTTPTAVSGAIDNAVTDNSKTKWLVGEGAIGDPAETEEEYPKRKRKVTDRTYEMQFTVKNLVATQYEFLRQLQCGATDFTFFYGDLNDFIYGKVAGIAPEYVTVRFPRGGGRDDKAVAIVVLRWSADGDPERRINPL